MDTWRDLEVAAQAYGTLCADGTSRTVNFYQREKTAEKPFEYWFHYGSDDSQVLKFRSYNLSIPEVMGHREWYFIGSNETISTVDDVNRCRSYAQKSGGKHVAFYLRDKKAPKTTTPTPTTSSPPFEYWFQYGEGDYQVHKFQACELSVPGLMGNREWYYNNFNETIVTMDDAKRCGASAQKAGGKHVVFHVRDKKASKTTTPPFEYWFYCVSNASVMKFTATDLRVPELADRLEWYCLRLNETVSTLDDVKRCATSAQKAGCKHMAFHARDKSPVKTPTPETVADAAKRWYEARLHTCFILSFIMQCFANPHACICIAALTAVLYALTYAPTIFLAIDTYITRDNMVASMVSLKLGTRKHVWATCVKHEWKTEEAISELMLLTKQKK